MKVKLCLIIAPIVIWIIFFLLGLFSDLSFSDQSIYKKIEDGLIFHNSTHAFWKILKNNILIIAFNIIGFTSFGFLSFLSVLINGFHLGLLISNTFEIGISYHQILNNIVPHGIFELIGLWASSTAGIHSTMLFIKVLKKNFIPRSEFLFYLKFALIAFAFTFLSSIIESYYILPKYL